MQKKNMGFLVVILAFLSYNKNVIKINMIQIIGDAHIENDS
jgi:hypothetical protein